MSGYVEDGLDRRTWEVAAQARRFRLLASRPEFLSHDRAVRAEHATHDEYPQLHTFDAAMAIGSSELDRFCGYCISLLNSTERRPYGLLIDALGILDPDRVAAIYFALKPERRKVMRNDPACAYHVQQVERDFHASEVALEEMLADTAVV